MHKGFIKESVNFLHCNGFFNERREIFLQCGVVVGFCGASQVANHAKSGNLLEMKKGFKGPNPFLFQNVFFINYIVQFLRSIILTQENMNDTSAVHLSHVIEHKAATHSPKHQCLFLTPLAVEEKIRLNFT